MESGIGAKRVAWAVIVALGCGFCYSIGFQSGWSEATVRSDQRMEKVTESLQELVHRSPADEQDAGTAAQVAGQTATARW